MVAVFDQPSLYKQTDTTLKQSYLPKFERLADLILGVGGAKNYAPYDGQRLSGVACSRPGCGHAYIRHFAADAAMAPVGCSLCDDCPEFVEPVDETGRAPLRDVHPGDRLPTKMTPDEEAAHQLLHKLWSKAVGSDSYDKKQWQELEGALFRLSRESAMKNRSGSPVCGDHWHGLSGQMVEGSTGCPWCHVDDLQRQVQRLEANMAESKRVSQHLLTALVDDVEKFIKGATGTVPER
jgi:hypothetical protein